MQLALTLAALIGITVFGSTCNNPVETTMAARARTTIEIPALDETDASFDGSILLAESAYCAESWRIRFL